MRVVFFLVALLARCNDVGAGCGNYVVAAVGGRVICWFVLAHEDLGDAGCDAAEWTWVVGEGEVMPCSGVG